VIVTKKKWAKPGDLAQATEHRPGILRAEHHRVDHGRVERVPRDLRRIEGVSRQREALLCPIIEPFPEKRRNIRPATRADYHAPTVAQLFCNVNNYIDFVINLQTPQNTYNVMLASTFNNRYTLGTELP